MKITDYVTLLKAGMTLDEIRQREADEAAQDPQQNSQQDPKQDPKQDPQQDPKQDPKQDPQQDPQPDYKSMYEAQAKELEEKNQTIKDLQKQNTQENMKPDNVKSDSEIFEEALRSFM